MSGPYVTFKGHSYWLAPNSTLGNPKGTEFEARKVNRYDDDGDAYLDEVDTLVLLCADKSIGVKVKEYSGRKRYIAIGKDHTLINAVDYIKYLENCKDVATVIPSE
jgi:hypothetical protein